MTQEERFRELVLRSDIKGRKVVEIIHVFPVLYQGWECDDKAAVVKFLDGSMGIIGTDHGGLRLTTLDEHRDKIKEYESAIMETHKAIRFVEILGLPFRT